MFENFIKNFKLTENELISGERELYSSVPKQLFTLLDLHGGKSFNKGLYRVHSFASSIRWSLIVTQYFIKFQTKLYPFGYDWMGRQFCMSTSNNDLQFMLDPGTGEEFELKQELNLLHDHDFVNDTEDMLASSLFSEALKYLNLDRIGYNDCIGYRVPLFLGGEDDLKNLMKSDLEVYWEIQNQLLKKVQNLPNGTNVNSIKID